MAETVSRRDVLAGGGLTLGVYLLGGTPTWATAAEARARGFTPRVLKDTQLKALESLAEQLVPGAVEAGIAPYVDAQLAAGAASKLMAKYIGVPTDQQTGFYGAALDAMAASLATIEADQLPVLMASDSVADWQGPPASYVFFVFRADALDVTYGTEAGFAQLDIPYMAHIAPETPW